jgi:transcriptional regulator with XRE-family HTH domain
MYRILVKRHRRRRRIRQKDLSKKSGVSESHISHLEADNSVRDRTPTLQTVENLAIAMEICPYDIVMYPCIECVINSTCSKPEKDMRDPDIIIDEILDFYL